MTPYKVKLLALIFLLLSALVTIVGMMYVFIAILMPIIQHMNYVDRAAAILTAVLTMLLGYMLALSILTAVLTALLGYMLALSTRS